MRRGFTLIELLVVVGIIAVLAGLLFPAIGLVKKQANSIKCSNNLKQVAIGIMAYRNDHNDGFPGSLSELFDSRYGDYFESGIAKKVLICPFDIERGSANNFNRPIDWKSPLLEVYNWEQLRAGTSFPVSYLYEASSKSLDESDPSNWIYNNGVVGWFSYPTPSASMRDGIARPIERDAAGLCSWAAGKINQQKFGNVGTDGKEGYPFSSSVMPIMRCFYHQAWTGLSTDDLVRKVNGVSFDGNIFWSIPKWEHEASEGRIRLRN